MFFEGMPR